MILPLLIVYAYSFEKLCSLCTRWGEPALEMVRAGATEDEIRPIALRKCDQLAESHSFYGKLCKKAAEHFLSKYIAEARSNDLTALQYCKKKKFC